MVERVPFRRLPREKRTDESRLRSLPCATDRTVSRPRLPFVNATVEKRRRTWRQYRRRMTALKKLLPAQSEPSSSAARGPVVGGSFVRAVAPSRTVSKRRVSRLGLMTPVATPSERVIARSLGMSMEHFMEARYAEPAASPNWRTT
jgi:hypothetical protein